MSRSPSAEIKSTWGKFKTRQAAEIVQSKLKEAGIEPEKITLEEEDSQSPIRLEDTEAISNLKSGAIAGGVLGALIGLSISLIMTNFADLGLSALSNFQTIHYFAPILGAIVGAVGISLISGLAGGNVPQSNADISNISEAKRHFVVVKGTTEDVNLAKEIMNRQGGVVEEADRR